MLTAFAFIRMTWGRGRLPVVHVRTHMSQSKDRLGEAEARMQLTRAPNAEKAEEWHPRAAVTARM